MTDFAVMTLEDPRSVVPSQLRAAGASVLRFPLREQHDVTGWLAACDEANVRPLAVYDGEATSLTPAQWMARYPNLRMVETANEWTTTTGVASSPLAVEQVADNTRAWLEAAPNAMVILGAIINGPAESVQHLLSRLTLTEDERLGIGLHLYDTWPPSMLPPGVPGNPMADCVEAFAAAFGPRIFVTETGVDNNGGWQVDYCYETLSYLAAHPAIQLVCWYNVQDYVNPAETDANGGLVDFGLFDVGGNPKLTLATFQRAAAEHANRVAVPA